MRTVAGVAFQDLWAWKCPDCKTRYVRDDERQLAADASAHYTEVHAVSKDQLVLCSLSGH